MTAAVAAGLLILALLDGSFAGFRASAGRTGLINHRQSDRQAARRGAGLTCVLLSPVITAVCADAFVRPGHLGAYTRAGTAMLAIYGPYALLVLTALACYATLNWRLKYLASALILGPLTLLRPGIAVLRAACGAEVSNAAAAAVAASLSAVAVLTVEPLAGRLWYAQKQTDGCQLTRRSALPKMVLSLVGYVALGVAGWRQRSLPRSSSVLLVLAGVAPLWPPYPPGLLLASAALFIASRSATRS